MNEKSPIINILTYKLPFKLANQIYNEYISRLTEAKYLIENYKTYNKLKDNINTVELFLALSIFHKRIITNFDGAVKFYGTVTKNETTDTIQIGSYKMNGDEKNKILAVVLNYRQLLEKFSIHPSIMEYYETRDFLRKIISLKSELKNARYKKREKGEAKDDLPF